MDRAPSRYSGGVGLAARNEKHVPGRQLDFLVRCRTRIDRQAVGQVDGMRYHRFPEAPSLPAVDLHGEDVMDVPMRPERTALGEAQISIHLRFDSHLSLDGRGELTDLRN